MITVNLNKAKTIAHAKRRDARANEFKPYDEIIAKQIPGLPAAEAEAVRAAIRQKYAQMQSEIDAAQTVDQIKNILAI